MNLDESELKKKLRAELRARVKLISPEWRMTYSEQAAALLRTQDIWKKANAILFYSPLPDELDVLSLISEAHALHKTVVLPRFEVETGCYSICEITNFEQDLVAGKFGISEPRKDRNAFPAKHLDFVLVPGVGFDAQGARLGRGRGFYDRLLAQVSGVKCGIAFDEQIVPQIPTAPHDIKMNCVLTPTRWLSAS